MVQRNTLRGTLGFFYTRKGPANPSEVGVLAVVVLRGRKVERNSRNSGEEERVCVPRGLGVAFSRKRSLRRFFFLSA